MTSKNLKNWKKKAGLYHKEYGLKKTGVFVYEIEINTPSLEKLLPDNANNVLDLGSGVGFFTKILAQKYPKVMAHESTLKMLDLEMKSTKNLRYKIFDLEKTFPKFNCKFDLIVTKLVLMYVKNLENVVSECNKLLTKNGSFVVSVTHPIIWHTRYLENKYNIKKKTSFEKFKKGYFSELPIRKLIGDKKELEFEFIHRTFSTYLNTFAKHGLFLKKMDEPEVNTSFVKRFPQYKNRKDVPLRLNMLYIKN